MKKITDFIIDKRNFILILFIIFTIISALMINKVKINSDIAKYLPNNSETRIGMNIMEKEFAGTETSNLNLMFENLKKEEKISIKKDLETLKNVDSVDYNNSKDYNSGKYTLYVININGKSDSKDAASVFDKIQKKYENYTFYTSGSVSESNKSVLPFWIVALAVFCAFIILIIMCESYVEPFLFLTTILMAVVLNKGTNIIFPSVSHITDSIVAILQMALSMDYSIMLLNRYNQEKKNEKDKVKAMKKALHKAFQSISSSSITTIVGLLALIFMSFRIGMDLGLNLSKGVLFSLICIFFVLPSLILMFDKWIIKSKKKSPRFNLNKLGQASYKIRYIALPMFLLIFGISFLLKGNLGIDYTDKQSDDISKIFKENNQIAIIYKNKDEEKISKKLKTLEKDNAIIKVLGYGNTINEKLTYNKLNAKLNDLGSNVSVEDYLLKIIYYNYYNKKNNNKITLNEFINFIETEAYNNPKINEKIDTNMKKDIARLKNFVLEFPINKKRTASEIAQILEIDESDVKDLFIYYLSKNSNQKMTLNEFLVFMNKDVLTNEKYASKIDNESKAKLNTIAKFTNKNILTKKLTNSELAEFFGLDTNVVNDLLKYCISKNDINLKLTISNFSNFIINNVLKDSTYSNNFDDATKNNIRLLANFSNNDIINKEMSSDEIASLFGISEDSVKEIFLSQYLNADNNSEYDLDTFIKYLNVIKSETHYLDDLDTGILNELQDSSLRDDPKPYYVSEMAEILSIEESKINQIYNLIDFLTGNNTAWKISPFKFVEIIFENENISKNIEKTTLEKIKLLQMVMESTLNNKTFSYSELSEMIGLDTADTKNIYTLYIYNTNSVTLTPKEFVNFILENKNDQLLSNISKNTLNELQLLKEIMDSVLTNKKYSSDNLSQLLSIDKSNVDLLYGLYSSLYVNENYSLSMYDFINFILDDVITNNNYAANFDNNKISKLNIVKVIMNNSLNNTKYSKDEMFTILNRLTNKLEKNMIEMLYIYYGSNNQYNEKWQMTVEQFVDDLNNDVLKDDRFTNYIDADMKKNIIDAKATIKDARKLLVGNSYSRIVLNTNYDLEGNKTFKAIQNIKKLFKKDLKEFYVIGDSPMAYDISTTFNKELNLITIITMIAIFIVVAITFKSIIIPTILVLIIQCAVYLTMGILSFTGDNVYFISILIVQSILMGATIDYAILYTSFYLEHRKKLNIKEAVIESYNRSINTILTSSSILTIVTLVIASFTSAIAAKICKTISAGTICSTILILLLLPAILAFCDKLIVKKNK